MLPLITYAYDFEVDGIYYIYNANSQSAYVSSGDKSYKGNLSIPESVTYNGRTLPITAIADGAFWNCMELTAINIPTSITEIGEFAFFSCTGLEEISLPNSIKKIGANAFWRCSSIKSFTIPNSVVLIEDNVFKECSSIETIVFEDGDSCIELGEYDAPMGNKEYSNYTFQINPKNVYIGRQFGKYNDNGATRIDYLDLNIMSIEVLAIGQNVIRVPLKETFYSGNENKLKIIYSLRETPPSIGELPSKIYTNTTLYVPIGSESNYQSNNIWGNFFIIKEMDVNKMWNGKGKPGTDGDPNNEKCEKPTISYSNGKLTFNCSTEGATCQYTITDSDIKSGISNEVQLGVTYNISVYATKYDYENSETATATLCWIDLDPKTEGITDGVAQLPSKAVLIQSEGGILKVEGIDDGTPVSIFTPDGMQAGCTFCRNGAAFISTNIKLGNTIIVKIGDKSVKVVIK